MWSPETEERGRGGESCNPIGGGALAFAVEHQMAADFVCVRTNIDNQLMQRAKIFLCVKIRPIHPVLTAEDSKLPALLLHHQSTTHRHHTAHPQPTKAIENHRAMPESATKRVCTNYDFVQVMSGT